MNRMKLRKLDNESGLVSVVVTVIIMSLLTLMALGFASLAEREKRQALDQQLSSQAFYAAESAINRVISEGLYTEKSDCNASDIRDISTDGSVSSVCLLVDPEPETLDYSDVSTDSSIVIPIDPNGNMTSITISWEDKGGSNQFASDCSHNLMSKTQWLTVGVPADQPRTGILSAMLIPAVDFTGRPDLIAKTYSFMLYPRSSAVSCSSPSPTDPTNSERTIQLGGEAEATKGGFIDGNCDTNNSYHCSVTLSFSGSTSRNYILRLKSVYRNSKVKINGSDGVKPIQFENAQTEIDSTGKVTDVLRRLKVNVPHKNNVYANKIFPEFAVESADTLCKRLQVGPDFAHQDDEPVSANQQCLLPETP